MTGLTGNLLMVSEEKIKKVIERLVEAAKPLRIFLFGSYARGEARTSSDLDFLVVERNLKHRRSEMVRLHDAIRPMRVPVDIIVISEASFNQWSAVSGTVIHKAKTEGQLCYDAAKTG